MEEKQGWKRDIFVLLASIPTIREQGLMTFALDRKQSDPESPQFPIC
jgi:hypothetical protein